MTFRFPPIEPHDSGLLETGDGHRVYWEACGNPNGKPAIYLHGGPGSGATPGARRYFDPDAYRVLLFDQRGCGRSSPLASEPDADLSTNTTPHLIADIEQLRRLHGVDGWTVLGISWGTTLGLAYAQAHPQAVAALVLACVGTDTRREIEFRLRFARLVTHYWRNAAFLDDDQILRYAATLNGIPGVLIHGRYDVSGPLETAWRLSQAWSTSRLKVIDDAGHGGSDAFSTAITDALSIFATR
jgi:proline iminopeptidase